MYCHVIFFFLPAPLPPSLSYLLSLLFPLPSHFSPSFLPSFPPPSSISSGQDWSPAERTTPLVSGLMRIQRLMLTLLPHFWSKQSWRAMVQLALSVEDGETQDVLLLEEASLLVQQICANIVAYCRVAMTMGGIPFSMHH